MREDDKTVRVDIRIVELFRKLQKMKRHSKEYEDTIKAIRVIVDNIGKNIEPEMKRKKK
jgi:hypothetical protein